MKQALHILAKDARYLRKELALIVTLSAGMTLKAGAGWTPVLLAITCAYTVARLIHAEKIPGDRQFWITRPYRWQNLLAAKALGVLIFVSLPVFVVQAVVLVRAGFEPGPTLAALIWSHFLLFACVWLPLAALAAVTSGIVPFIFSCLVVLGGGGVRSVPWGCRRPSRRSD